MAMRQPIFESEDNLLLSDPVSELENNEESDNPLQAIYRASFEELGSKYVQYDLILWFLISLVLVLAWGIGIIMLLYLPYRRYLRQRDVESRKLYVTCKEIVYKFSRPSFIPFCGEAKIERRVPLSMIIDVIIEQGCLQSVFGLHTFKVESIAYGKHAPVDELQIQGFTNPGLLRKIVVEQASKAIKDSGRTWNPNFQFTRGESLPRMESLTLGPAVLRSPEPSKGRKMMASPYHTSMDPNRVPTDLIVLHKLEEVSKSVKKLELLMEKNQGSAEPSVDNV